MSQNESIDNSIHVYFYQEHSYMLDDVYDMLSSLHSISMNM